MARRISLKRPKPEEIAELEEEVERLAHAGPELLWREAKERLDAILRRTRAIPYFDPIDVRYNRYERVPKQLVFDRVCISFLCVCARFTVV